MCRNCAMAVKLSSFFSVFILCLFCYWDSQDIEQSRAVSNHIWSFTECIFFSILRPIFHRFSEHPSNMHTTYRGCLQRVEKKKWDSLGKVCLSLLHVETTALLQKRSTTSRCRCCRGEQDTFGYGSPKHWQVNYTEQDLHYWWFKRRKETPFVDPKYSFQDRLLIIRNWLINWMNMIQGHGKKAKFGTTSAIFLVTCEKSVELCLQIPFYFAPFVLFSISPIPKFKPFFGDLSI